MPNNKNLLLRLDIIHSMLESPNGATVEDMRIACEESLSKSKDAKSVSTSTINNDLRFLRKNYGVQTELVPGATRTSKPIRYKKESNRYKKERFSEADAFALADMMKMLSGFIDIPYAKSLMEKLEKRYSDIKGFNDVVLFDTTPQSATKESLYSYYKFIAENTPVLVRYNATYQGEIEESIQPYLLKEYNSRWFLIGWNYGTERIEILAIDRIVGLPAKDRSRLQRKYDLAKKIKSGESGLEDEMAKIYHEKPADIAGLFKHMVGVTFKKGAKIEDIVIRVNTSTKPGKYDMNRLETKKIHWSQTLINKTETEATYMIQVYPNRELYAMLCQYENIEIVSPAFVRKQFIDRTNRILSNFIKNEQEISNNE